MTARRDWQCNLTIRNWFPDTALDLRHGEDTSSNKLGWDCTRGILEVMDIVSEQDKALFSSQRNGIVGESLLYQLPKGQHGLGQELQTVCMDAFPPILLSNPLPKRSFWTKMQV
jgi:hypothetical protein